MKIFVNTRSTVKDYRYLGDNPNTTWLETYKDTTSFEHPTIILERTAQQRRLFLSGISSNRKDKVGTTIRYSFMFEFSQTEEESVILSIFGLVKDWVSAIPKKDVSSNAIQTVLTPKLDKLFTEEQVVEYMSDVKKDQIADEIQKKVTEWLLAEFSVQAPTLSPLEFKPNECYVETLDKVDNKFLPTVYHLLMHKQDIDMSALYLNFIDSNEDIDKSNILKLKNNFILLIKAGKIDVLKKHSHNSGENGAPSVKKLEVVTTEAPQKNPLILIVISIFIILFLLGILCI